MVLGEVAAGGGCACNVPGDVKGTGSAEAERVGAGAPGGSHWAVRPTQTRVLRMVAAAAKLPIETIVGPGRARSAARARAIAAYLLSNDAGLSVPDIARIIHREADTVTQLIKRVDQVIGSAEPQAELLNAARKLLRNGISTGRRYPPLPYGTTAVRLLPGLLACRLSMGFTQAELAERAGIARETLARLERLRRQAKQETLEVLAQALGQPAASLTLATEDLPVLFLRPKQQKDSR